MPSVRPVLFVDMIGPPPSLVFLFFVFFFDPSERESGVYDKSGLKLEQVKDKVVLSLAFP